MIITVQSNAAFVAEDLRQAAVRMPEAEHRIAQDVAKATLLATTQALEELIYDQPLPASYARYGLHDRTGALLAGESRQELSANEQLITTENTGLAGKDPTLYAEWRHEYPEYPAPWRTLGLDNVGPRIRPIAEQALLDTMGGVLTP